MTLQVLANFPDYMKKFECIGPACTNSCCIGWNIDVDKETFKNFKKEERRNEFVKEMMKKVHIVKEPSDTRYAFVELERGTKRCALLNNEDYCTIYRNMNHDAMSSICCTYPRVFYKMGNKTVICAHISCPEIALEMLKKDNVNVKHGQIDINSKARIFTWDEDEKTKNYYTQKNAYEILIKSITLMNDHILDIDKRLMILGMLSYKIFMSKSQDEVKKIIEMFDDREIISSYNEELDKVKPHPYMQCYVLLSTINNKGDAYYEVSQEEYIEYLDIGKKYLSYCLNDDDIREHYPDKIIALYDQFVAKYSHVLQNYIVNTLLEDAFPNNNKSFDEDKSDIFYCYLVVLFKYAMLRALIIGYMYVNETEMTDEIVTDLLNRHGRSYQHSTTVVDTCIDTLKEEKFYSLAGALVIARFK